MGEIVVNEWLDKQRAFWLPPGNQVLPIAFAQIKQL